jgi:hypothetical protein
MDDKTFSEHLDLICEGSWWKRIDDDAVGTILEIRDDNSNNLIVRWTHPSFEGLRSGECDRHEFVRKWVPLSSHSYDVPVKVDSIWKSNKTGDIVKVLIAPTGGDLSVHYINLNDITGHHGMSNMDRAAFITEHAFLRDNDNGALYRHNKNVNMYFKVIETTEKACMGVWMRFVKYRLIAGDTVKEDGCFITTFYSCCHLLSLDPEKEYTVPIDSVRTIKVEDKEMDNSKETYLKTDESKMKEFSSGAKREDKSGKGRYDLIPGDVMNEFEDFAWIVYFKNGATTCSPTDVSKSAYFDDWTNVELYYDFIFHVVSLFFVPSIDREECEDDNGEVSYEITWDGFRAGLYNMRNALAKHYEAGAVVHGVDNWKKGLPIYGSERGGCFLDSMRRHIDQALQGKDDEPHAVAAIWNAFGAVWTLKNKPTSTVNLSEDKTERVEDKSNHLDEDTEYLTLPSGRKIRVMFLHSTTDDEKDVSFLKALGLNDNLIDNIMEYIKKGDQLKDK